MFDGGDDDDRVGYGRPPKHSRFKPGQSGNPRGRGKKRESLQDIVANVLFEKMEVRIGERTRKIANVNALMRTAVSRALKGDYRFLMAVLAFIRLSGLSDIAGDALVAGTDPALGRTVHHRAPISRSKVNNRAQSATSSSGIDRAR